MDKSLKPSARLAAGCAAVVLALISAPVARASESGASVYLLGSGGPGAAVLPPIQGVFFANTLYFYSAEAGGDKAFPVGGGLVAGLDAQILADFATVLWVPTTDLNGVTVALGAALPVGEPSVDVTAIVSGPRGGTRTFSTKDSNLVVGDPLLTGAAGFKTGKLSVTASTLINIPIGQYDEGALANLAFHRWAVDGSLAMSWIDPATGWDVSGKAGLTFNGENEATDYDTGAEFHLEGAVEKSFSKTWSAGIQGYYFEQVSGDSGPGATLGPFKGRVAGLGATAAYSFAIGHRPATLRLHVMKEFEAKNRPEGTSVFLDFSVPLKMVLPAGAPGS